LLPRPGGCHVLYVTHNHRPLDSTDGEVSCVPACARVCSADAASQSRAGQARSSSSYSTYVHAHKARLGLHPSAPRTCREKGDGERERSRSSSSCTRGISTAIIAAVTSITSPASRLIDRWRARRDTTKTTLAFPALACLRIQKGAQASGRTRPSHAKAVKKGAQVSTAHWRRGGRSWAQKGTVKKKTCTKRPHRHVTLDRLQTTEGGRLVTVVS
jgi:hypothetical protein